MRRCAICVHKKRSEIETAMISGESSYSTIAHQYGVKLSCLKDHKRYGHIPVESLVAAKEEEEQHSIDVFANPRQDRLSHDWPSKAKRQSNSYSKASAGRGGSRDDY